MIKTKRRVREEFVKELLPHEKARAKAETWIVKLGVPIPECPDVPDQLSDYTNRDGEFIPPSDYTVLDDEELGAAYSYMSELAAFIEAQLGFTKVEQRRADNEVDRLLDQKTSELSVGARTQITKAKAEAGADPEVVKAKRIAKRIEGDARLLEHFLEAYNRRCQAMSRELTRRTETTSRWERGNSRFSK